MRHVSNCFVLLLLAAAANAQNPRAEATATFRIDGIVVNCLTGQPVRRVMVSIGPAEQADSAKNVVTNQSGQFNFGNLKRGKYWLQAQGRGFAAQRFDQHNEFSTAIAVGPNLVSSNLVFRLCPDATILGSVTDEQNEPVRNAQVMLFRTGVQDGTAFTRMGASVATDDLGQYRFSHLSSGTYYVAVSARPWYAEAHAQSLRGVQFSRDGETQPQTPDPQFDITYPITFNGGVTDQNAATPLVLKAGERLNTDIALVPVPSVHVRITDSNFDPSKGFGASLSQYLFGTSNVPVSLNYESAKAGEIEVSGVPPGKFVLALQSGAGGTLEKQVEISGNSEIDASDASTSCLITGSVQFDSGEALSQPAIVRLSSVSSGAIATQTSPKGEFSLPASKLRAQRYEVSVLGVPGVVVKSLSATDARIVGRQIEIAGASVRLKVVVSKVNTRIDGTALLDGHPFAGAMIVLVPQDMEHELTLVRRDQSDSDGTFSLYNVLPGKYTVVAIRNEWDQPWLSSSVIQGFLKNGETVDVAPQSRPKITVNVQ
jgi:hypothetical protein